MSGLDVIWIFMSTGPRRTHDKTIAGQEMTSPHSPHRISQPQTPPQRLPFLRKIAYYFLKRDCDGSRRGRASTLIFWV